MRGEREGGVGIEENIKWNRRHAAMQQNINNHLLANLNAHKNRIAIVLDCN